MRDVVVPFISGWAMGIHKGVADVRSVWNERFPDIQYQKVEEASRGLGEDSSSVDLDIAII